MGAGEESRSPWIVAAQGRLQVSYLGDGGWTGHIGRLSVAAWQLKIEGQQVEGMLHSYPVYRPPLFICEKNKT